MELLSVYKQYEGCDLTDEVQEALSRLDSFVSHTGLTFQELLYQIAPDLNGYDASNLRFALFELLLFNEEKQALGVYIKDELVDVINQPVKVSFPNEEDDDTWEDDGYDLTDLSGPANSFFELSERYNIEPIYFLEAVANLADFIFPEEDYLPGIIPDTFNPNDGDSNRHAFFNQQFQPILLEHHQEVALGIKIMCGQALKIMIPEFDPEDDNEIRHFAYNIDALADNAKDQLIERNYRLVLDYISHHPPYHLPKEVRFQEGCAGLTLAAMKYDYRKGFRFSTYATNWIRQSVNRLNYNFGRDVRLPANQEEKLFQITRFLEQEKKLGNEEPTAAEIAAATGLTEKQVVHALNAVVPVSSYDVPVGDDPDGALYLDYIPDSDNLIEDQEAIMTELKMLELVKQFMHGSENLKVRNLDIFARYYLLGYYRDAEKLTYEDIGKMHNITRERVRQIIEKIQEKMNSLLKKDNRVSQIRQDLLS